MGRGGGLNPGCERQPEILEVLCPRCIWRDLYDIFCTRIRIFILELEPSVSSLVLAAVLRTSWNQRCRPNVATLQAALVELAKSRLLKPFAALVSLLLAHDLLTVTFGLLEHFQYKCLIEFCFSYLGRRSCAWKHDRNAKNKWK